jgi:hypothetical protein
MAFTPFSPSSKLGRLLTPPAEAFRPFLLTPSAGHQALAHLPMEEAVA